MIGNLGRLADVEAGDRGLHHDTNSLLLKTIDPQPGGTKGTDNPRYPIVRGIVVAVNADFDGQRMEGCDAPCPNVIDQRSVAQYSEGKPAVADGAGDHIEVRMTKRLSSGDGDHQRTQLTKVIEHEYPMVEVEWISIIVRWIATEPAGQIACVGELEVHGQRYRRRKGGAVHSSKVARTRHSIPRDQQTSIDKAGHERIDVVLSRIAINPETISDQRRDVVQIMAFQVRPDQGPGFIETHGIAGLEVHEHCFIRDHLPGNPGSDLVFHGSTRRARHAHRVFGDLRAGKRDSGLKPELLLPGDSRWFVRTF